MKTVIYVAASLFWFLVLSSSGYNQTLPEGEKGCPTKYVALVKTLSITGNPSGSVKLFEVSEFETKCFDKLRIFVHVLNNSYQSSPFPPNSKMTITAFHGIGTGSWAYFSQDFPRKYTSEFHGYLEIPVIGEKTRLVITGINMPRVKLEVDVGAYLVK